jgi:hypothetical protein
MYKDEKTDKVKNHYNWKLVSKNRKQWMKENSLLIGFIRLIIY